MKLHFFFPALSSIVVLLLLALSLTVQEHRDAGPIREHSDEGSDADVRAIYERMSTLSWPEVKRAYLSLVPETRARLWRYHLRRFLIDHSDLSAGQREVITDAIRITETPHLFDDYAGAFRDTRLQLIADLKVRISGAFPPGLILAAFHRLGKSDALDSSLAQPLTPQAEWSNRSRTETQFNCECRYGWECGLFSNVSCVEIYNGCIYTIGCGVFLTEACDGLCI